MAFYASFRVKRRAFTGVCGAVVGRQLYSSYWSKDWICGLDVGKCPPFKPAISATAMFFGVG